jgi:lysine-specific demethylase 8
VGRKYVRLFHPSCTPALYPYKDGLTTNSSQVDVDAPDHTRFPLFGTAQYVDCILEAGQMLYIPPGWWHYVRSLSVSFSVSFWWA